jgi:hypothetical protein
MLSVHALVQNGYALGDIMEMDAQDLQDWLETAVKYKKMTEPAH